MREGKCERGGEGEGGRMKREGERQRENVLVSNGGNTSSY